MIEKILIVDDEENVLNGIKRSLRKTKGLHAAVGAAKALEIIDAEGPFAVVISDQQMPDIDGITFLKEVRERNPMAVRMMLSGNADQKTAVDAVKDAGIFRFLNKPCSIEDLSEAADSAINHFRLQKAEKDMLQDTLAGSVKMIVDIISMRDPESFARISRMREWGKRIAAKTSLPDAWKLDMALIVARFGEITLPDEVSIKISRHQKLNLAEQEAVFRTPEVARDLIKNIPKMEELSEIVYYQDKGFDGSGFPEETKSGTAIPLHARLIKILKDLSEHTDERRPTSLSFDRLKQNADLYDSRLVEIVRKCLSPKDGHAAQEKLMELSAMALEPGDIVAKDIYSTSGTLILSEHHELSDAAIQKIKQYVNLDKLEEPLSVRRQIEAEKPKA